MAKKENKTAHHIVDAYMKYVSKKKRRPKSVYAFMKKLDHKEKKFYQYFTSFEHLEQQIFVLLFEQSMDLLKSDKEYKKYDAKNKLLSFYFTFFEMLSANRSFVKFVLDRKGKDRFQALMSLHQLRKHYIKYYQSLNIKGPDLKVDKLMNLGKKSMGEMAWKQMLFILKFWLQDKSPNFEKTDLLIEKSLHTSFELMDFQPLEGLIDLGKFLFKERMSVWR